VYIMASRRNGTLYVGVTNDLTRRVDEHRQGTASGFTKRYGVDRLVYYEEHGDVKEAIERGYRARETDQEMATGVEDESDRGYESPLARFEQRSAIVTWIPAFAGMTKRSYRCRFGMTNKGVARGIGALGNEKHPAGCRIRGLPVRSTAAAFDMYHQQGYVGWCNAGYTRRLAD